ncbi:MAG: hypothetical protein ABID67_00210 [Candidatus Nealsonbacteria bacterium]
MAEISQQTKTLIRKFQDWYQLNQTKTAPSTIHVDEVTSVLAEFYEKIREVVDWREEHLMRRAAIERILKRRLLIEKNGKDIATPLVTELIRGGHFPNDKIPESKIIDVQNSLSKYFCILENESGSEKEKQKVRKFDWLLSIAACELEEVLSPPTREQALIDFMTELMEKKIEVKEGYFVIGGMSDEEKNLQIYVAVQRALFKLDTPIINYNLLKRKYSNWSHLTKNDTIIQEISKNIYALWSDLDKILNHPMSKKFYKICERYDTPHLILGDVISENPMGAIERISDTTTFETKITEAYNKRLKSSRSRVKRAAFYATLSILITKTLLALSFEIPFDKYVTGQFDYVVLGLNIVIPPILMFFLVLTIKPPRKENLQQVIMETIKTTYEIKENDIYPIKPTKKRGWLMHASINILYLTTFFISFGLIIWGLRYLNFGVLSIIIFLIFVALISFAGVKIRERSKELEIVKRKESFLIFFIDLFSLPIIRVGKWLSGQWTRYNIVVILLNFLIDMPFQKFVEFLEQWREFLKEKKEEIH